MVIRKPKNSDKWSTQKELPILNCLEDVMVYCIVGHYFYHSEVEALGFDGNEMKNLYVNEFRDKKIYDMYDHVGIYTLERCVLKDIFKKEKAKIVRETKESAFSDIIEMIKEKEV